MANLTDPLAKSIHGGDPQNLIEYITRQKIYDSRYWKEECFGLNATNVLDKAMELNHVGGTFGANLQPTNFLSLVLKMLQIQPEDDIILALVQNEDFKYVRALGAFYLRLTCTPAQVYEYLEPLYNDYRKLRHRKMDNTGEILCMDEFVDALLRDTYVCGIAMPRLPPRDSLYEAGYLDDDHRVSVLGDTEGAILRIQEISKHTGQDNSSVVAIQQAQEFLNEREIKKRKKEDYLAAIERAKSRTSFTTADSRIHSNIYDDTNSRSRNHNVRGYNSNNNAADDDSRRHRDRSRSPQQRVFYSHKGKEKKSSKLFKKDNHHHHSRKEITFNEKDKNLATESGEVLDENSEEYWNQQRAKLGLKPLKK